MAHIYKPRCDPSDPSQTATVNFRVFFTPSGNNHVPPSETWLTITAHSPRSKISQQPLALAVSLSLHKWIFGDLSPYKIYYPDILRDLSNRWHDSIFNGRQALRNRGLLYSSKILQAYKIADHIKFKVLVLQKHSDMMLYCWVQQHRKPLGFDAMAL